VDGEGPHCLLLAVPAAKGRGNVPPEGGKGGERRGWMRVRRVRARVLSTVKVHWVDW